MANRAVSIWKSVKIGDRWKYCRPVIAANGSIKPHWVHVNGHKEEHKEGNYYLHFREGSRQVWKKVGPRVGDATFAARFEEARLGGLAVGLPMAEPDRSALSISGTLLPYLKDYELSKRAESYALMEQTLKEFAVFCNKQLLSDITRTDLLRYKQWLVNKGRTLRTAGNKMMRVNQYLRNVQHLDPGKGLVTVKDAKFVETEPEVYDPAELEKFFAACTGFQFLVFKTLLMSGLRKQEMENLEWRNVNFTTGTIAVKASAGFSPKTWEERTIEIPSELLDMLAVAPKKHKLVFATKNGNKYTHVWDDCRDIAKRAELTEDDWHPHKFRSTYATKLLQSGVDLKTVQNLLGHKNLESTMRYLARAESSIVRAKMDDVWKKPAASVQIGKHAVNMETKITVGTE